jgi:hypothetical protein
MTPLEIQNHEKIVQEYRNKKNELQEKKRAIEKLRDEKINDWQKQAQIDNLYSEIAETEESEKFQKQAARAQTDSDFEKYFRAAHLKYFFGIIVDTTKL